MDHDEVSLFIGCLPGEETRQILLFPGGHVLADIRSEEIFLTHPGDPGEEVSVPDSGWTAASALIQTLTRNGWYIEDLEPPTYFWLRPRPDLPVSPISIRGVTVNPSTDGPSPDSHP